MLILTGLSRPSRVFPEFVSHASAAAVSVAERNAIGTYGVSEGIDDASVMHISSDASG
ncbi:MAG: hypothetical protein KFH87_09885 [Bacteroidetes bacterium]|nr:hypothetical protein [Bacteroidota bacterium]